MRIRSGSRPNSAARGLSSIPAPMPRRIIHRGGRREFERLRRASALAHQLGLVVNAGHGINYVNITEIRTLPHLHELNIGHSS